MTITFLDRGVCSRTRSPGKGPREETGFPTRGWVGSRALQAGTEPMRALYDEVRAIVGCPPPAYSPAAPAPSHPAELSDPLPQGKEATIHVTVPRFLGLCLLPGPKARGVAGSEIYPLHNLPMGLGSPLKGLDCQSFREAAFFITASPIVFRKALVPHK